MAPIPLSLLQNVRNQTSGSVEKRGAKPETFVDNDDLVFDIIATEEIAPQTSTQRTVLSQLAPSSVSMSPFPFAIFRERTMTWQAVLDIYGISKPRDCAVDVPKGMC